MMSWLRLRIPSRAAAAGVGTPPPRPAAAGGLTGGRGGALPWPAAAGRLAGDLAGGRGGAPRAFCGVRAVGPLQRQSLPRGPGPLANPRPARAHPASGRPEASAAGGQAVTGAGGGEPRPVSGWPWGVPAAAAAGVSSKRSSPSGEGAPLRAGALLLAGGAAGLASALAALGWGSGPGSPAAARCEAAPAGGGKAKDDEIRFVTYNVLSPPLCEQPGYYPHCDPYALDRAERLRRVLAKLQPHVEGGAVIALQEVTLEWAGKLHVFFSQLGYHFAYCQYGSDFSGYMGVAIAWPLALYEAQDVDLSRLSDFPPKGFWPPQAKDSGASKLLARFGFLTYKGLCEVLGCKPPPEAHGQSNLPTAAHGGEDWRAAQARKNELALVRLRPRGGGDPFCVACYHMPCLFGPPEKVRTRNIHALLMLAKVREFARGDRCVLMGDYNWKPLDSSYALLERGGDLDFVAGQSETWREEVQGLRPAAELAAARGAGAAAGAAGGDAEELQSAYKSFHGAEPAFTNYAQSRDDPVFCETLDYILFSGGRWRVAACPELPRGTEGFPSPCPTCAEPSDHLLLAATLRPVA